MDRKLATDIADARGVVRPACLNRMQPSSYERHQFNVLVSGAKSYLRAILLPVTY